MQTVKIGTGIEIPVSVAVCPICGATLQPPQIDEWECNDDGTWQVSDCGVHIQCTGEPDIDSADWAPWLTQHWSSPYIDWLPVEERVTRWLQANYRFEVLNIDRHSHQPHQRRRHF